ncbi:hypothetical protein MUG91_G95n33 [Manis pentadactyla]|nr:hypothetical protein MUG91_G95n33 [Manis pentadactyla]
MQPTGQHKSHWLGQLMTRDCPLQPKGMAWTLDLPQETLSPCNSHRSALLVAQMPRDNLGNIGEHQTSSQFRHGPSQGAVASEQSLAWEKPTTGQAHTALQLELKVWLVWKSDT